MIHGRKIFAVAVSTLLLAGCEERPAGGTGATKDEPARSGNTQAGSANEPGGSAGTTGGMGGSSTRTPGQTGAPGGEDATSASEPGAPDGGKSQKEQKEKGGGGEYGK